MTLADVLANAVFLVSLAVVGLGMLSGLISRRRPDRAKADAGGRLRFRAERHFRLIFYGSAGVVFSVGIATESYPWGLLVPFLSCAVPQWIGVIVVDSVGVEHQRFLGLWRKSIPWSRVQHAVRRWEWASTGRGGWWTSYMVVVGRDDDREIVHQDWAYVDQERFIQELEARGSFRVSLPYKPTDNLGRGA